MRIKTSLTSGMSRHPGLSRYIAALCTLVVVVAAGTIAYVQVEDWGVFPAFYQTLIVISTLGIRQVKEMSRGGEIITLLLIVGGVGAFTFFFSTMATLLVEGQMRRLFGRRKLDAKIGGLKGHYIICGYGRMGQLLAQNLKRQRDAVVVIDKNPDITAKAESDGFLYVLGNAHEESVLKSAGIDKAKGIVSVLKTDADNVFVALTAREISDGITILAPAMDPGSEPKLRKAGVDRVYNLHVIGANRITMMLTHPTLLEFIDSTAESVDIEVQEVEVKPESPIAGLSLRDSNLREKTTVQVIAIKKKNGKTIFTPSPSFVIESGDLLVCVGGKDSTGSLVEYINPD
ncbi:MAG: potassium channel protein [Planctomycetota bacterium]